MAGDSHSEGAKSGGGLSSLFNGNTLRGRANVAKATYAVIGLIIAYNVVKPKKK
ncbi:PREDICTED: putative 60S ribosomal protein L33 [Rhagoletis zephyria]|uniref:putative 60S ribosomal protein L33 n=1 Tax=Rhagoletis zephyria TaxID=28612 RepID=UPI0008115CB0|nr:PREDICTED: putative 60S ribosomal protein L33 [Rhagoletis zephyria]XP_036339425.1 putative 60S ribosomal protein L33 [Rhagoletis pomonella]